VLSEALRTSGCTPSMLGWLDQGLSSMQDALGTCERLLRTPIPLSYTRHTSRFLVSVCLFLLIKIKRIKRKGGGGGVCVCV
jgi:predicted membrane chloride channel (bestrophin family)